MDGERLRWLYHRLLKDVTWKRIRRCRCGDGLIALAGLHAVRDARSGVIHAASVSNLSRGEATVARRLIRRAGLNGCLLRADANYDSNALYRDVSARGGRLIARLHQGAAQARQRPEQRPPPSPRSTDGDQRTVT